MRKGKERIVFSVLLCFFLLAMAVALHADIKKLSAETLKASIDSKEDLIVVDVREKDEFASGHIQGAINLPLTSLEKSYDRLPLDKKVVLYCNSAARSNSAARILLQHDYQKIEEMEGFKFWVEKRLPSVKGN